MGLFLDIKRCIARSRLYNNITYVGLLFRFRKYKDKSRWVEIQRDALYKTLKYAQSHSLYYRNLVDGKITKENVYDFFYEIPLLDKNIIRKQGNNIYANLVSDITHRANTGVSTGEPLSFPCIYSSTPWENINQLYLYKAMNMKFNDLIVSIDGTRVPEKFQKKNIFWVKGPNFPYGRYSYSTQYLTEKTVRYYIKSLNSLKPSFLRGYPSGIKMLCRLMEVNLLGLDFTFKGVYLTSENFTQEDKQYISRVLNCPVYGQYGHTESSVFAVQRPDAIEYICSPIYGITEILDECGKQVKENEIGEIVVTGFSHLGTPFIRYKTGDLAVYGGTTEFGEVVLKQLMGRSVDFVINKHNEKIFLVGFIFGGHIEAFNYIQSWQIIQNEIGTIDLLIVKAEGFISDVERQLVDLFGDKQISINIEYVDHIEKTKSGKQKFLIQNIA